MRNVLLGLAGVALSLGLTLQAEAQPTYTVIHTFGASGDGAKSWGGLAEKGGALFGTTMLGGSSNACPNGCGVVYEIAPSGGNWKESILYSFGLTDGANPVSAVVFGTDGALYGTTTSGGTGRCSIRFGGQAGCGTVFKLTRPSAGTTWTETVLHSFDVSDGIAPYGAVVFGSDGALYGTTAGGGAIAHCSSPLVGEGCGTVFKLAPPTGGTTTWTATVLHVFKRPDGYQPTGALQIGPDGELYGTVTYGGPTNQGGIFKLTPPATGTAWTYELIFNAGNAAISGGAPPFNPSGDLLMDKRGALYATSVYGGTYPVTHKGCDCGTVFKLTPPATPGAAWRETTLFSFGGRNGEGPRAGVVMDGAGNLFGTTELGGPGKDPVTNSPCTGIACGVVFELVAPSGGTTSWTENVLQSFVQNKTPFAPTAGVILDKSGRLFGTTSSGVDNGKNDINSVVFEISP